MKRLLPALLCLALLGCAVPATEPALPEPTAAPSPVVAEIRLDQPDASMAPTAIPTPEPTPEPTPTPTPVPPPRTAKIGAVGDIMIPSGIVGDARRGDGYDFSALFAPCAELFHSVDLMCANLEAPLAGERVGYSAVIDGESTIPRFNAPDSLLDALKNAGFDLLTTANNHMLDKEPAGLYRTVEVIRSAGFLQTGTFSDESDRETPCIVDVNGIRVGIVAATRVINERNKHISMDEAHVAIGLLSEGDQLSADVLRDLERVRNAGAEFVIVFAHWDYENPNPPDKVTRKLAQQLLEAGADCIVGSHPHYAKSMEFLEVTRDGEPFVGLVAFSLGNFTANEGFERSVGLYLELTLEKNYETNTVSLIDAAYLPTYVMRRSIDKPRFAAFPVYADLTALEPFDLTAGERKTLSRAREYAAKAVGTANGVRLLDE